MPRLPRLHVPGGCYHVILRGNHRENIFSCADDRLILNSIVADSIEKCGARVHAYCWIDVPPPSVALGIRVWPLL
jgi:putative transposase